MAEHEDHIVRAVAADGQLRVFAAVTRDLVEQARSIHQTSPVATAALGRLLTAGAMMGSMMKGEKDILTLQIQCDGPIGGLTVTADAKANVRGYVKHPKVMLPPNAKGKLDVSGALGKGFVNVIRDIGMKEPYNGQTPIVSGEIAEDLTYYFAVSEQVPSSVGLGVLMDLENHVRRAGGFIIQVLPFAKEEVIDRMEKRIAEMDSVTNLLESGMEAEDLIRYLAEGLDVEILDRYPTAYRCNCSRKRVYGAVASIGKKDLQEMIEAGEPVEVHCDFCGKDYTFDIEELREMLK